MNPLKIFVFMIVLAGFGHHVYAACCAWDDRDACASCPVGYYSGCVTKGAECNCDCTKSASEIAKKMSYGDYKIRVYIEKNFRKIIQDTKYYRYHDFQGMKLSITPSK